MQQTLTGRELAQARMAAGVSPEAIAASLSIPLHAITNIEGWYDEAFCESYLRAVRRVMEQTNAA